MPLPFSMDWYLHARRSYPRLQNLRKSWIGHDRGSSKTDVVYLRPCSSTGLLDLLTPTPTKHSEEADSPKLARPANKQQETYHV